MGRGEEQSLKGFVRAECSITTSECKLGRDYKGANADDEPQLLHCCSRVQCVKGQAGRDQAVILGLGRGACICSSSCADSVCHNP